MQLVRGDTDSDSSFPLYAAPTLVATVCMCKQEKQKHMQHTRGNLHYVRKLRRMSQRQVAHLIGHRDATMLSKYERGLVVPTLRTALKLTLLYRLPIQEIFADEFAKAKAELTTKANTARKSQQVLF